MTTIDRVLSTLPDSTHAWTCPWHWWIAWWGSCALLSGLLAQTLVGALAALFGFGLLVLTFAQRRTGQRSCRR